MASCKTKLPAICLQKDVTDSALYKDIEQRAKAFLQPDSNEVVSLHQISYSPNGQSVVGAGTVVTELKGSPASRIVIVDIQSGSLTTLDRASTSETSPEWSPDGSVLSFLAESQERQQLYMADVAEKHVHKATDLEGSIERHAWSPCGKKILLIVAGVGAEKGSIEGSGHLSSKEKKEHSWQPTIETVVLENANRTVWIYDVEKRSVEQASHDNLNVWEAVWTVNGIVGLCSDLPGEDYWYSANLRMITMDPETCQVIFEPKDQIHSLTSSPDGKRLAYVTGLSSDRGLLLGHVYILDVEIGTSFRFDTKSIDMSLLAWAGDNAVIAAGCEGNKSIIARCTLSSGDFTILWEDLYHTTGVAHPPVLAACQAQDTIKVAFVRAGFFSPPTLVEIAPSGTSDIRLFSSPTLLPKIASLAKCHHLEWTSPDGTAVQGYLLTPNSSPTSSTVSSPPHPYPTLLYIHGGPVWQWKPSYLGAGLGSGLLEQTLLSQGYAVFKPNQRGSTGRGQAFSRAAYGDFGGLDAEDLLAGIDYLVDHGWADAQRLGVFGSSYGGLMSAWLMTRTTRFRAAVPAHPVIDWVSELYTCNIAQFALDFVGDDPHHFGGKFYERSPLHHVRNVGDNTACLVVCGGRDRCTPPGQALEFHRALVANGKTSVLLTYPEEGHGVRAMPAQFDLFTRVVEWFKHFV